MIQPSLDHIGKYRILIPFILVAAALLTILFLPEFARAISTVILLASLGMAMALIVKNHWQAYVQADCTREKMLRNISLDLIGLLLTMAAAIFAGGQAGGWAGMRGGLWAGLAAGFAVGFFAALLARSAWGRLVLVR